MKKLILLFLILCIMSISASAIIMPLPINGKIDGSNIQDITIKVTNLRSGISMETSVNSNGEFLLDWANSLGDGKYYNGDNFKIQAVGCDKAECSKEVVYTGQPNIYVEFEVFGVEVVEECKCQYDDWQTVTAAVIFSLLTALILFMGGGIKIYKNRIGGATLQHKHKGIRGYHDPSTKHKNPLYSHRRWSDSITGCINDVKKIEEQGGL